MEKIDLQQIVNSFKLTSDEISGVLFPDHLHPKPALTRALSGLTVLDANQISRLSLHLGVPISDLFTVKGWKSSIINKKHILTLGEYRAELDTATWTTDLFYRGLKAHEFIIHTSSISLGEYIERINIEIEIIKIK